MGLHIINERINQLEASLSQVHREPIKDVPTVVQFDGIRLSLQTRASRRERGSSQAAPETGEAHGSAGCPGPVDRWERKTAHP